MVRKNATKKQEPKDDLVHLSNEPHKLPCPLDQKAIAEVANELASEIQKLETLEGEKKSIDADYNGQIKVVKQKMHSLSQKVTSGEEMRSIDCELKLNYSKQTAILTRTDTKAIVEERPMTEEEKQMEFDMA